MPTLNRTLCIVGAIQIASLALTGLQAATSAQAKPDFEISSSIKSATTSADHEKIAAYFEQEATDLDSKSALHREMKKTYQGGGHLRGFNARMRAHCERLANLYKAAAIENREMAKSHLTMTDKKSQ